MRTIPEKSEGFWRREAVEVTGLPFWTGHRWINVGDQHIGRIQLTKSRAAALGFPIANDEPPVAFRYCVAGPGEYKYAALYDRTKQIRGIPDVKLFPYEKIECEVTAG